MWALLAMPWLVEVGVEIPLSDGAEKVVGKADLATVKCRRILPITSLFGATLIID